jgi:arabinogalactan oligomer/maltooligosaccharide transport system substrate-binding protein
MMRAGPALLGVAVAFVALGCSETRSITLWHSYRAAERTTLEAQAARWNTRHPELRLELLAVPNDTFADKITTAVPRGHGPDLIIFAHDRLGDWVESGVLEPLEFFADEALCGRFIRPTLDAMTYQGSLYGLPLAFKSTALFFNRRLVSRPPETTDELVTLGRALTNRATGRFGLIYPATKLYFHAAWLHGFGGSIFDPEGRLSLGGAGAFEALAFARDLAGPEGIVPAEVEGHLLAALFNDGRGAMVISGPWFVGEIRPGVEYGVAPLPRVSATGKWAAPFLGVEGLMMSARAHNKAAVFEVMRFLTADEAALPRAVEGRQTVANISTYLDSRVRADATIMAFREQADRARPMPATPEMRMVWTPYDLALQAVVAQGRDAQAVFAGAHRQITSYIRGAGR